MTAFVTGQGPAAAQPAGPLLDAGHPGAGSAASPWGNHLLATLHGEARARVSDQLELVDLKLGEILCETGQAFTHGYFPVDSIVSILYVMENAQSAEIAVVGNDGMVGVSLFMGGGPMSSRAIVQNAGRAYRMDARRLHDEFARGGAFQRVLLCFAQALITQMVQTAACNRHHTVDQQFCRWLLMSLDRLPSNQLKMTRKLIGNMLGISGTGVRAAVATLTATGTIAYKDGNVTVLDRDAVAKRSCECYRVVKDECERLLRVADSSAE
jgi:CRP-like cAMP-binding protein